MASFVLVATLVQNTTPQTAVALSVMHKTKKLSMEEFIESYESALESQDWDNVSPLILDNCVATFTEGTYVGNSQAELAFRKTFSLIKDESYKISNLHFAIKSDSIAVIIYNFN